jgi:general secretion pathway protein I
VTARARGFTLIEVLVAIGIAAIGLAAVLAVVTNSTSGASSQHTRTLAGWIAANHVVTARLAGALPSLDTTRGDESYANFTWRWEQKVTQTEVKGIRRVDVRVWLADDPEDVTRARVTGFVGRVQSSTPPSTVNWEQSPTAPNGPTPPGGPTNVSGPGTSPPTTPPAPGTTGGTP